MKSMMQVLKPGLAAVWLATWAVGATAEIRGTTEGARFGLYPSRDFRLVDGKCADCPAPPAALWYFRDDVLAVPNQGAEGYVRGARVFDDVRQLDGAQSAASRPPLLWVGAPLVATGKLTKDAQAIEFAGGKRQVLELAPKLESNRSYFDTSSQQHFAGRTLHWRGELKDGKFIGRTLWPADYALDASRLKVQPLQAGESLDQLIRAEQGGVKSPMSARVLWQRDTKVSLADKPVLAFVLNGAQGDDDEALGGHFAIATGRFGSKGEWGDWIVNNFYNLDSVSEKGIVASSLPLDAYQGDLNRGQSWYRPSYFLVAVLKNERVAAQYQQAMGRVFNHFYRHDFTYNHANANCAGISMETLRALGWQIPKQGPTSRWKAIAALPVVSIQEMSLENGKKAVDYLMAEQTSLYPMVAFQAAGQDLLGRIAAGKVETAYEKALAEDLEAIVYVRIPQFPSSRAFGNAPVASIDEYVRTAPADRKDWKTTPAVAREFPQELRDPQSPSPEMPASDLALAGYAGFFGVTSLGVWHRRRKKRKAAATGEQ